ncbi:lipopolysaccharide/colanic/teichoic acid biosynthesis glycosyltransferase [Winogradskyella epiphytica]|uniref:Lipopolysaccharide/colanic/teichoic acid biosynthesis glycosyltransferase n=1 Tax=Winogradskyella epiphytica TaxID=262005 RepID=A0A2V4XGH3_9FLAO|nr:sugar transferase [Winogradskyella epiphytica]PYE82155.1 lipopolysaccharide/colanic/teichoic acid biosynthesis glycosyltransferase [Winogradskyella epiphytica]GGW60181.1 glycosyl transferase [Winogradskyella epiphytica]
MISKTQLQVKGVFDTVLALVLLSVLLLPIGLLVFIATIDTRQFGLFSQSRVGQYGQLFTIYKIRTLRAELHQLGHLERSATLIGGFLRRTKLDELPQLFNVLKGDMSFVGPRPDLPGFADVLEGEDRIILKVKPGITGPATLKYKNEEALLAVQSNPDHYNRTVIWVDKVKINKMYVQNYSFCLDLSLILKSIINK